MILSSYVNCKIVIDEKDGNLAAFLSCTRLQQQQLFHDAFIRAKADRVAKKSRNRANAAD
jgi:hypothetical protein